MPRQADDSATFRQFIFALFSQCEEADVRSAIAEVRPPIGFRVRAKLIYSAQPIAQFVTTYVAAGEVARLGNSPIGYSFTDQRRNDVVTLTPFGLLATRQPNVHLLLTICDSDQWDSLRRMVRRRYPELVPIYLSQRELVAALHDIRRDNMQRYELRIREYSAREYVRGSGETVRRSVREWTLEGLEGLLDQISDRRQTVSSITLSFHRRLGDFIDSEPIVTTKLFKSGESTLDGLFGALWQSLLDKIAQTGQEKLQFFSRRGLRETNYRPRPIVIHYGRPYFADLAEVRRLVSVLQSLPKSQNAVAHGNPYAHVQVADSFDGSSFDVWAVSENELTLVPRLKATEAAVNRLVKHLFEHFHEGSLEIHAS